MGLSPAIDLLREKIRRLETADRRLSGVLPFGVMPKTQGIRSNVEHYKPFWNPRLYNVWLRE